MAEGYLAWDLANLEGEVEDDFEELEEVEMERVRRRELRDMMNPFDCPESSFRNYFRLSRELARDLCEWLRPHLERGRRHGLCAEKQVCSPSYKITQVCARYPGRRHDSFIWNASPLRQNMMDHYAHGERQTWLIGDSGYPSEPWLLTPIPDAAPNTPEFWYTVAHCKARSIIERCFGLLKGVWNCLSKKRVLLYDPVSAGRIINACVVLHNLRLEYNMDPDDRDFEEQNEEAQRGRAEGRDAADDFPEGRNRLAEGRRVRDAFIQRHFAWSLLIF